MTAKLDTECEVNVGSLDNYEVIKMREHCRQTFEGPIDAMLTMAATSASFVVDQLPDDKFSPEEKAEQFRNISKQLNEAVIGVVILNLDASEIDGVFTPSQAKKLGIIHDKLKEN